MVAPDLVRSSGDDADDLAVLDVFATLEHLLGHGDEFVGVARVLAEHGEEVPQRSMARLTGLHR